MIRRALAAFLFVAAVGCGDSGDPGDGAGPEGGAGGRGASSGDGGAGGGPTVGPHLILPAVIDLPYVVAGNGGSEITIGIINNGTEDATGLTWSLAGSDAITLLDAPDAVAAESSGTLVLAFEGAAAQTIEASALALTSPDRDADIPVFAVAGDPGIGTGTWETVGAPGGFTAGEGITISMPTAPFPHGGDPWTDPSVRIFVPESYRDRGAHDFVLHFHGHSTLLADTLAGHRYESHVYASGANAILVVPQGPYQAASGNFGKLMDPGGVEALLRQVLVVLYRDGRIASPVGGELALTSHSGGYIAVATNLDPSVNAWVPYQIGLFDSIYGYQSTYAAFAEAGGILRSDYTTNGGTVSQNQDVIDELSNDGFPVSTQATTVSLAGEAALVYFADASHNDATRLEGAYGEQLRWRAPHHRRGARIELRAATAMGAMAELQWAAPVDEDTTGFSIERADGADDWSVIAEVGPTDRSATVPWTGGGRLRIVPVVEGLGPAATLSSDVVRLDNDASILVVDGFTRILDGSWGGLAHDFAAVVGEAVGGVHVVSASAITEDGFDLSPYSGVVWLAGDQSTLDRSVPSPARAVLDDYVSGGGRLIMSGSEIGYDLSTADPGFLDVVFGAAFAADSSGSYAVTGAGVDLTYGGPDAPYEEDYPDAFTATGLGEVLLQYDNGQAAAVGIAGRTALVGFPLELIDGDDARAACIAALLDLDGS